VILLIHCWQDFLPRLKNHLLARILEREYDGDEITFTPAERNTLVFVNNRIYRHKVIRVNYTTYDLRRAQDSLNPRTHADVMVLSQEDEDGNPHPYWYARIIGVFHTLVQHVGPLSHSDEPRRMEFLWVRWFGRDLTCRTGWKAKRLHRVGFLPSDDPGAFVFINPHQVIRGVHLIPAFVFGRTPTSAARATSENNEDWVYYYVGM